MHEQPPLITLCCGLGARGLGEGWNILLLHVWQLTEADQQTAPVNLFSDPFRAKRLCSPGDNCDIEDLDKDASLRTIEHQSRRSAVVCSSFPTAALHRILLAVYVGLWTRSK